MQCVAPLCAGAGRRACARRLSLRGRGAVPARVAFTLRGSSRRLLRIFIYIWMLASWAPIREGTMAKKHICQQYVEAAVDWLRRQGLMTFPDVAEEMKDQTKVTSGKWSTWKPIKSKVTDEELDELEEFLELKYPPAYRQFLKTSHFYGLSEHGVDFGRHPVDTWRDVLTDLYSAADPERTISAGLIPFGRECFEDAGFVCFDTRARSSDGDCPVVYWDRSRVGSTAEINPMFSSSTKMFECLLFAAKQDVDFMYPSEEDDEATLAKKRKIMADFLAIDPAGAGKAARKYWTSQFELLECVV